MPIRDGGAWNNILDYGIPLGREAVGTKQIQRAIDEIHGRGGGTLYFPPGDYCTGSIVLKSRVRLFLDVGAVLWASKNKSDYIIDSEVFDRPNAAWIAARDAEQISITGGGTLSGGFDEELAVRVDDGKRPTFRWKSLRFENCRYVSLSDLIIRDMEGWTVGLRGCDYVNIDNVSVHNNYWRTNTDGIQIAACRDVHVSNCSLIMGDDAFALFATKDKPCEQVTITNCTMQSASTGIKLGGAYQNFRDITVSNCVMTNCMVGIGFYTKAGGCVERILFSNLTIGTVDDLSSVNEVIRNQIVPIFIDIDNWHGVPGTAILRDVTFTNIAIDSEFGVLVQGMDDNPVQNLTLRDITFRARPRIGDYSGRKKPWGYWEDLPETPANRVELYARKPAYITIANAQGLYVDHVNVIVPEDVAARTPRSAMSLHRVNGAIVRDVSQLPDAGPRSQPVVVDAECRSVRIGP